MLGLSKATEMNRPLPKKAIFDKFKPSAADRQKFDGEIRRLAIVGEVSPTMTNIAERENITAFFVVLVSLRGVGYDKKNLFLLSTTPPQADGVCCLGKVSVSGYIPFITPQGAGANRRFDVPFADNQN